MSDPKQQALQKIGTVFTVTQELWDQRSPSIERVLEADARTEMAKLGTVVGDVKREVGYQPELGGIRLHGYDEEGNELPPMVAIYFSAYALPHEEN